MGVRGVPGLPDGFRPGSLGLEFPQDPFRHAPAGDGLFFGGLEGFGGGKIGKILYATKKADRNCIPRLKILGKRLFIQPFGDFLRGGLKSRNQSEKFRPSHGVREGQEVRRVA